MKAELPQTAKEAEQAFKLFKEVVAKIAAVPKPEQRPAAARTKGRKQQSG